MKRVFTGICILVVLMIPAFAFSIETDVTDAFVMPAGLNAMIMYYKSFTADTKYVDGHVDNSTTYDSAKANVIIGRVVHYGKLYGDAVYNINVLLPMGSQEVETRGGSSPVTSNFKQTGSGIGDMVVQAAAFIPLWKKSAPSGHLPVAS
jgi:hypothetical protein